MTFTISDITRCSSGGHWHFTVQVGQQTRTLTFNKSDFDLEPDGLEQAFLNRVRSAIKESGATTFAQAKTAILNQVFKL